jgi:hypothetical protein
LVDESPGLLPVKYFSGDSFLLDTTLRIAYGLSQAWTDSSFEAVLAALDILTGFGVSIETILEPASELYTFVLRHAPLHPLKAFAFAARHQLENLAVSISPYLLSYSITSISDDMAVEIGPIYLKRLLLLQHSRLARLKEIVYAPPFPHAPTPRCDFSSRKAVSRAWTLASAQVLSIEKADLPLADIEATLGSLAELVACPLCAEGLRERVRQVTTQWLLLDRTI